MLENIIYNHLYFFFNSNELITKYQSGHSTTNQLLGLVNEIHASFDQKSEDRTLFLDISKAFDKVWHQGLNFTLKKKLSLLDHYLSDRKQRVIS